MSPASPAATSVAYDLAVGRAPSAAWRYARRRSPSRRWCSRSRWRFATTPRLQTQPLHRFLWNGAAAAGVAVSLLLAALVPAEGERRLFARHLPRAVGRGHRRRRGDARHAARPGSFSPRRRSHRGAPRRAARRNAGPDGDPSSPRRGGCAGRQGAAVAKGTLRRRSNERSVAGRSQRDRRGLPGVATRRHRDLSRLPPAFPRPSGWPNSSPSCPRRCMRFPADLSDRLGAARIGELGEVVTIQLARAPLSGLDRFLKRAFDLLAAGVGLIVLSPLLALVALAIKLDSPRTGLLPANRATAITMSRSASSSSARCAPTATTSSARRRAATRG